MTAGPLAEAKRQAALDHVLTAARRFVIENGLDATMEQLAEASGVSRRTLFRLFGTREKLVASAFSTAMVNYMQNLPGYDGEVEGWLRSTCEAAHRMNAAIGPGFWELMSRSDLPPEFDAVQRSLRQDWRVRTADIARLSWQGLGRLGETPDELLVTVGAHLSSHFTAAVVTDAGRTWQTASELAYKAIIGTLRSLTPEAPTTAAD
ncbi:hypothetical protein CC117_20515 [Parafrankia colletiae]|uniref:HTH tetR-type domain-containing protein n=1 Tax=Parafrankia colletiae TaxID=573497 RepID=A0A1S1QNS0_9ACTN|nr:helix-turn-helix domain-containing protein [Parafrankia colletiae]MCK9902103.1 TetR/AcrR family transcriptional regulator [Frankia sp. Cpl3]OHV34905.1 hypothetical protein CC117_20515 [Parafrankia colletiae]